MGYSGAEGEKNDDWLAIDCFNIGVHLMLPTTRAHLNLEEHLTSTRKPVLEKGLEPDELDQKFDKLLDDHPIPKDYNKETDAIAESFSSGIIKVPKDVTRL